MMQLIKSQLKQILLILTGILFLAINAYGQDISRQEVNSILAALGKSQPDVKRIDLLIELAQFYILKPGENQTDYDSAEVYLKKAEALNVTLKSSEVSGYLLLTQSFIVKEKGKPDEAKNMAEKALEILKTGNNKDYLGQAYYGLNWYYDYSDSAQLVKKLELVKLSVDAFHQARDLKRKGRSLEMLGDLYVIMSDIPLSIEVLNQALAAYDSVKYERVQGVYALLGEAYRLQRENKQALAYMLKALKAAKRVQDSSMQVCQITMGLATLYRDIDRKELGNEYSRMALEVAQKHHDEYTTIFLANTLCVAYIDLGQPKEALQMLNLIPETYLSAPDMNDRVLGCRSYIKYYLFLKKYDKAWPYCKKLLAIANDPSILDIVRAELYRYLALYYFYAKQYSKTRHYLVKTEELDKGMKYGRGLIEDARLLYRIDSAEGNLVAAFRHLIIYKRIADSASNTNRAKQLEVLGVEYEIEMKEDSIRSKDKDISFLRQETNLQQANLQQAGLIKNLSIVGAILLLILLGLVYNRYRQKQKTNHLLQLQKEEINKSNQELKQLNERQTKLLVEKDWLVKEIHHRVKNNLQMVVSLLNAQTEFLTHPSAIDAIKESRERMQAIAIIHQKLYQLDNSTQINMRSYINELIDNIRNSFTDSERIHFTTNIMDVFLDVTQSVPLGLILNEAITNAIKYAYPKNEKGPIRISLKCHNIDKLQLKIADNGKGLPDNIDIEHSNSLGLQLIRLFSEQLDGDLYFMNNNGLEITMNFKVARYQDTTINKIIA